MDDCKKGSVVQKSHNAENGVSVESSKNILYVVKDHEDTSVMPRVIDIGKQASSYQYDLNVRMESEEEKIARLEETKKANEHDRRMQEKQADHTLFKDRCIFSLAFAGVTLILFCSVWALFSPLSTKSAQDFAVKALYLIITGFVCYMFGKYNSNTK